MNNPEKNLEIERLVFFSDAIVAIAITLLALNLKVEKMETEHLTFADLGHSWKNFFAFFLSFFIISIFWRVHHKFFFYIRKIDSRLLSFNLMWLLFIVILPFGTTLVSSHFFDTPAAFVYTLIIFSITCCQNLIWDYVAVRPSFLKDSLTEKINREFRVNCNISMGNAVLAMLVSLISPVTAFIILLIRPLMFRLTAKWLSLKIDPET